MSTPTVELGDPARSLAAFEYWLRAYRRTWRSSAVTAFVMPVLFLGAFGLGLGSLVDAEGQGIGGVPYLEFVAPGILAASAMQSAFSESTWPILSSKKMNGHYFAQAGSPLTVPDIVSGQLLFILFRLSLGAVAFTVVGALFGAFASPWVALAVPIAVLTGLAHVTPLLAFSITRDSDAAFPMLIRFVMVPLYLFAGTFFPVSQLPAVVEFLAWLTPLWHGTQLCRDIATGDAPVLAPLGHVAYLVAWVVGGYVLAVRSYRKVLHA
ncbi:ABC transporter permease [Kineosporia succinea]|uniref:Transport permease protein n=1 Tax=Kineosporia succinea TaxID=84632 RepID=A0ABT9NWE5_9ACTN|nr:ABC transporter permease [Kineosporia succinea]MDP9824641.1 lipooligosaccharide transport system permease protein [Kineosporia succinea]